MSDQNRKDKPSLSIISGLLEIAKELVPGLPWPIKAFILLVIIIGFFVFLFVVGLEVKYRLLLFILYLLLVCVIFMIILNKWSRHSVNRYPGEEMIGENTIVLANQLNKEQKEGVCNILKEVALEVAKVLNLSSNLVRSNLFGKDEHNSLRMIRDLMFQMDRFAELTISMPVGYGSTGRCFSTCEPNIAVLENNWGKDVLEDEELKKVHPDLKWIISIPVLGGNEITKPIWVLNVDGLQERKRPDELRSALSQMFKYSKLISLILTQK
ncbi:hypothetical protein MUO65_03980 [bacterium]|nr:hypothetical protein [bacterium]